jgi:hypothetical protein
MSANSKSPTGCSDQRGLRKSSSGTARHIKNITKARLNQGVPIPGTALTAFLKRYRGELLVRDLSRELSLTLDCVDNLLMLVERGCHE